MTCPVTTDLGAYVLGALEPRERHHVEGHLADCPACAAELAELEPLPALLDKVPREDLEPVAVTPSPGLYDRVVAAADLRPARRRGRLLLVAAALVAVLGVGAGVTWELTRNEELTRSAVAGPVQATLTASSARDGSALDVTVAGLRSGELCTMVAIDDDGRQHAAGEWRTSDAGDGRWVGWSSVDPSSLDEVVLLGDGGRELVRLDL
ncbi:MAG TPA: zf-HC2 domain-containing protein [Blastococcus sp.]|jgi:anti-sigma factor RsiW